MNNTILITGVGGPAGRSAALYLKEKGFRIIGTDINEVSTPVDMFIKVSSVSEPLFSSELLEIVRREGPSLFVPTVQEELPQVAELRTKIEELGCAVFISDYDSVSIAHDKLETMRYMERYDVPVPLTFHEYSPKEIILNQLGIPMLSKPCVGRGGRGVKVYRSREEVCNESRDGLLFQEFVPGEDFDLNLFVSRRGEIESSVVLKKTALKDGIVGNAAEVERVEHEEITHLGEKVVSCLKMEGPLNMDVRLREDGMPVLIEINARIGGNVLSAVEVLDCLVDAWRGEGGRRDERGL